jgi:MFS family permease
VRRRLLTVTPTSEDAAAGPLALTLVVILSAQLLVVLNLSIVNVALPSIQGDLGFSASGAQWVVNAYAITFGGLLMVGGRAGVLLGRRRLFLTGLAALSIASLVAGISRSAGMLVAARAAQGVGAALIAPTALAVLATTFPEGRARNRAIGIYGATASIGFIAGLLLGGVLVTGIEWRAVFWVNVPIGLAATLLGWISLPADRAERRQGSRPDRCSARHVGHGDDCVHARGGEHRRLDFDPVHRRASLAVILLVAFATWELRHGNPLMRLGVFRSPALGAANVVTFLFGRGTRVKCSSWPPIGSASSGIHLLGAGLASLPQALAGLTAGLIRVLIDRFGTKAL